MNTYTVHYGGHDLRAGGERGLAQHAHTNLIEMQSNQGTALSSEALSILQHFELLEEYHDNGLAGARR